MDGISSSIPFQPSIQLAARAYGVRASVATKASQPAARTEPMGPIARIGQPVAEAPKPASDPARLVAARVDPIDLARDVAQISGRPADGALPMYRHPADRNQAATAVALGRSLDIQA